MIVAGLELDVARLDSPLPIWLGEVSAEDWSVAAESVARAGGRLVSMWASPLRANGQPGPVVAMALAVAEGLVWLELVLDAANPVYPDLSGIFPASARMQRAAADLVGVRADGAHDTRPWLNHGAWPDAQAPLSATADAPPVGDGGRIRDYPFVRVEGDGVHEIPVGPVHAGIIGPGHFRFSVVGEKVLRLEARLGYKHKGIDRRFTELAPLDAHRLAGRVSGDSTVAYAWAYCMALEGAAACTIPARAACLRALMLERERVANHLGDLGALGNDAALAFGLSQFSRLKEDWVRRSGVAFGHRFMMDCVVPGGVAVDPDARELEAMARQCEVIEREVRTLRGIYDEHAGLQDRFLTTGRVVPELAVRLGLTGLAGRASAQANDLRCDHPVAPYDGLAVKMATHRNGDVAARVAVRFDEVFESLRLIKTLCTSLPDGAVKLDPVLPPQSARGAGWVEGWRGEVLVVLELDGAAQAHRILRCHCHDPSWHNWPVLEHAVIGNIVPDFPLINKSFNLSYAGHDR